MAATAWADQLSESNSGLRKRPIDDYGKLRILYFHYKNGTGGTLPDGTEIDLGYLAPGPIRILVPQCRMKTVVNGGAARTLDIGLRAYASKYNPNPSALEVESDNALMDNKDISTALGASLFDTANDLVVDLYSRKGILVFATVDGGTIPANWELEGYIIYVVE